MRQTRSPISRRLHKKKLQKEKIFFSLWQISQRLGLKSISKRATAKKNSFSTKRSDTCLKRVPFLPPLHRKPPISRPNVTKKARANLGFGLWGLYRTLRYCAVKWETSASCSGGGSQVTRSKGLAANRNAKRGGLTSEPLKERVNGVARAKTDTTRLFSRGPRVVAG